MIGEKSDDLQIKSPLSPSVYFLGTQGLSPSEQAYLDEQDRNRARKYQESVRRFAKKVADKPNSSQLAVSENLVDELKEQQRTLREMNQTYFVKKVQQQHRPVVTSCVASTPVPSREAKENQQPTTPTTPIMYVDWFISHFIRVES